jgi:hypothetical protein
MTKKYFKRAILGMLLVLASVVTISAHKGVPFYWNYINVDLNGDMVVTESQQYNFTTDHTNQRYSYIPCADWAIDLGSEGDNQDTVS